MRHFCILKAKKKFRTNPGVFTWNFNAPKFEEPYTAKVVGYLNLSNVYFPICIKADSVKEKFYIACQNYFEKLVKFYLIPWWGCCLRMAFQVYLLTFQGQVYRRVFSLWILHSWNETKFVLNYVLSVGRNVMFPFLALFPGPLS